MIASKNDAQKIVSNFKQINALTLRIDQTKLNTEISLLSKYPIRNTAKKKKIRFN